MNKSFIGERFHGFRVEVTDREHETGFNMLKVYGYGYIDDEEVYLGEYDVISIDQRESSDFCIDSSKPNSEFEIRITNKLFEITWNCESIRFRVLTFEEEKQKKVES